jgi:hypothetical protein
MTIILLLLLLSSFTPFQGAAQSAVFCDNVKAVASTLPNKTSSSPVHFATATVGQAPDVVYALALCRGDILDDSTCANCITNTFQFMSNATPADVQCFEGGSFYADCILVYNGKNILAAPLSTVGEYDDGVPPFERWNVKNVTGDVPLITGLIHQLLVETVEKAASSTPRRFATGVVDSNTNFPRVYSLAQCTPDLSSGDCLSCLNRLLGMINSTMALRMGGQMGVIRCYFRYDASQFYQGKPMISLGPASPAPVPAEQHKSMSSTNNLLSCLLCIIICTLTWHLIMFIYIRAEEQAVGNSYSSSSSSGGSICVCLRILSSAHKAKKRYANLFLK